MVVLIQRLSVPVLLLMLCTTTGFTSLVHARNDERALLDFISNELGVPHHQILDADGNLTQRAEQALFARPDVLEQLEQMIESAEMSHGTQEKNGVDSDEAQFILDDYLRWNAENNMTPRQEVIDDLLSQGAVMPGTVPRKPSAAINQDDSVTDIHKHQLAQSADTTGASRSLKSRQPLISNAAILGVSYQVGGLKTVFDYTTGLVLPVREGGGVYLLLKDGTALKNPGPPSDINIESFTRENPSMTGSVSEAGLSEDDIFPPHHRGYRLDFYGEDNTPGIGGPTLRAILLSRQGYFKESTTSLLNSPVFDGIVARFASSNDVSGSYFIDGNTIELQYNSGVLERRIFGTNGKDIMIVGDRQYRLPVK